MGGMKKSISTVFKAFGVLGVMSADAEKRTIARHAHGNVRLQLGQVMTCRKYEEQKKGVLSYDFGCR